MKSNAASLFAKWRRGIIGIAARLVGGKLSESLGPRAWPDIPTVVELGYKEAVADPWNGVLAPAGTPPGIIDRLYREFVRIVQQPDVRERFALMGMEPLTPSPDQFSAEIKEAVARWPAIVKAEGIRTE